MANEELPITPAIVSWARSRAGLSVEEATKKFKKIQEWEGGQSSPTYPQLEQLADALKVPIAVFFFPEPPDVPDIAQTFRTLPGAEFDLIPSRIKLLLRKAKALQLNLYELTGNRNPAGRVITRDLNFATNVHVVAMAEQVREYLGVSIDDQRNWGDDESALKKWREAVFNVGVFVFKDAFRTNEFSGFCLYDELFPVIYVNNSVSKTRQIFTIFHELAHLLFHTSGVDKTSEEYVQRLPDDAQHLEVLCNRFAAEFLLPDRELNAAIEGFKPSEATAERIAASFHVSREVVFRRFLDRGYIDQRAYNEAAARWSSQRQTAGTGGDYYWTKLAYLGRDYVALALSQYHQNRIDDRQLAGYLDTKPRNIAGLKIISLGAVRDVRIRYVAALHAIQKLLPKKISDALAKL